MPRSSGFPVPGPGTFPRYGFSARRVVPAQNWPASSVCPISSRTTSALVLVRMTQLELYRSSLQPSAFLGSPAPWSRSPCSARPTRKRPGGWRSHRRCRYFSCVQGGWGCSLGRRMELPYPFLSGDRAVVEEAMATHLIGWSPRGQQGPVELQRRTGRTRSCVSTRTHSTSEGRSLELVANCGNGRASAKLR